jgi:signal transduction histidine kinase
LRARLSQLSVLFTALLLIATWATVALVLRMRHDDALRAETRQNANLAAALSEQTARVLASADQATQRLRDLVQAGEPHPDLIRLAGETGLAPRILVQLSLVGPNGQFLGSNLDPDGRRTGPLDLSEREHVRVHLSPGALAPAGNGLYISKPLLGRVSKRWTIQLSRRINGPDGPGSQPLGVVVASLDPVYFEDVYRAVNLGQHGTVTLLGRDLTVRARVAGGQSVGMGTELSAQSPPAGHPMQEPTGTLLDPGTIDDVPRLAAWHQVGDYPLQLFVTTSLDEALQGWRSTRDLAIGLAALVSLALLAAAGIFQVSLRRLERSHAALSHGAAQAHASTQAQSAFLAAIAEQLQTPLHAIQRFAGMLEVSAAAAPQRDQAALIGRSVRHMQRLLEEILDLARLEAGALPVQLAYEPLLALVQSLADQYAPTAAARGLDIRVRLSPVAPAQVELDAGRVRQILGHLLSNAIQHSERGDITLEVDTAPGHLRFHVSDQGPGIPAHQQDRIFEKFPHRHDHPHGHSHSATHGPEKTPATTPEEPASSIQGAANASAAAPPAQNGATSLPPRAGLGLALSRTLAERLGGTLTVRSTPGAGARFTLSLPAAGLM